MDVTARRMVLSDEVYELVKELLFDQRLPPGERLNIDQLARVLQVSATPLREALVRIETEGLVVKTPLRGYTVTPVLDPASFEQLYDMRLLLEPEAARLAAGRITGDQLAVLDDAAAAMRDAETGATYRGFRSFAAADAKFHDAIASASGNRYLREAIARLSSHQQLSRLYFRHGIVDALEATPEHGAMADALRRHDARQAEAIMRRHVKRSRTRLQALLAAPEEEHGDK